VPVPLVLLAQVKSVRPWEKDGTPFDIRSMTKSARLKQRWDSLPAELQLPNQISGRHLTHCGFILGASYCSFHCTHCYLPKNANRIPIPSLGEVKEQIDANRRFQDLVPDCNYRR